MHINTDSMNAVEIERLATMLEMSVVGIARKTTAALAVGNPEAVNEWRALKTEAEFTANELRGVVALRRTVFNDLARAAEVEEANGTKEAAAQ